MEEGTQVASIPANTFTHDGYFYVHVTGKNGAYSLNEPFELTIQTGASACSPDGEDPVGPIGPVPAQGSALDEWLADHAGGTLDTVILWDQSRIAAADQAEKDALAARLNTLTGDGDHGVVVDVGGDPRIIALNAQADGNTGCVYAKNLVAGAIRDIVESYRTLDPQDDHLRYVALVGGDSSIPFFRYPDPADLAPESWYVPPVKADSPSEASLRSEYVLGQDEYGASTVLSLGGTRFPVPDLAVGRLVETAAEASGMIDAYLGLADGFVTPDEALVTGYDFLTDSSDEVASQLSDGMGAGGHVDDELVGNGWFADELRAKLLGGTHEDLVYLAGHFDANALLAADFATTINANELGATSPGLFANTLVWSTGCHAGYNVDDDDGIVGVTQTLDWAQAFARVGATLVAGTGFQYGDDELVEYSERIYAEFAHQLRADTGAPVSVGDALVQSKLAYLGATPEIKGMHQKALLTSVLFGLPMLSINMPIPRHDVDADDRHEPGSRRRPDDGRCQPRRQSNNPPRHQPVLPLGPERHRLEPG